MKKMLDLYCGEGLAAWGYWLSGCFEDIDGVDINDEMRTRYTFNFERRNALSLTYEDFSQYSFIHASPPCQAYSKQTPDPSKHLRLIAATHLMCRASGLPYVIENVEGSSSELRPNLVMDGSYFGLPSIRRRYFYASVLQRPIRMIGGGKSTMSPQGDVLTKRELEKALGVTIIPEYRRRFLSKQGMEQGIPPIFTKTIARLLFPEIKIG